MIAFPSALDNYIKCQLGMECAGHYMDDYYIIVPPGQDPKEVMALVVAKATSLKLTVSVAKSKMPLFSIQMKSWASMSSAPSKKI